MTWRAIHVSPCHTVEQVNLEWNQIWEDGRKSLAALQGKTRYINCDDGRAVTLYAQIVPVCSDCGHTSRRVTPDCTYMLRLCRCALRPESGRGE
jgi:hypothetical protein